MEGVLSNDPVSIVATGHCAVEIRPQGVTKGQAVEHMLALATANLQQQQLRKQVADIHSSAAAACGVGSSAGSSSPRFGLDSAGGGGVGRASVASVSGGNREGTVSGGGGGSCSGVPHFILCIGDDCSDEEMFSTIESLKIRPALRESKVGGFLHHTGSCKWGMKGVGLVGVEETVAEEASLVVKVQQAHLQLCLVHKCGV